MARGLTRGRTRLVAIVASVGLGLAGLAGCGSGGDIKNADTGGSGKDCGDLRIAVNPWTGYVANAHVIGYVAKTKLGCNVTYPDVKEEVGWQGMASGSIDTIVENWGHDDLIKKYVEEQKTVEAARSTGSTTWQMITKVQLPMARESLVLATNQGLLYVLSMVVIGGLVGGGSLGYIVVSGFSQDQLFGKGLAAGIAITALGVMLDRIARYAAARAGR